MQVILVNEVHNLGTTGDLVNVRPGYARNFLLPKKLAIVASVKNKQQLEHQQRIANFHAQKQRAAAQGVAAKLKDLQVTLARKVGEQEKLFGSVTAIDIHEALQAKGIEIDRRAIQLAEPIKQLGMYDVTVRLAADLQPAFKLYVIAE